jgi:general secretion pathway protein L
LPESAPALARELRQTFASFRASGGAPIAAVYLVGGGASAHGAEAFLSTELGVSILPLPTPRFEAITPEQAQMLPRFAKAIGLALGLTGRGHGLDLRKGPLEAERSYPFLREKIPLLAGLAAVVAVSFGFSVVAELRALDTELGTLTAELGVVSRDVLGEETPDPTRARELLEQGPGAGDEDPMPRVDAFDVMVALSESVPKDVVHDIVDLDVNRGHVIIQGTVSTNKEAEAIAAKLKEYPCFKDVKIPRTNQFAETKQKYVLEFDLKCEDPKKKKPAPTSSEANADAGAQSDDKKPEGSR